MYPDKALGLDGMNPVFFQHFWLIIKDDIVTACSLKFETCSFPASINDTAITLIPKIHDPQVMSNLRPISLCNVI